MNALTPIRHIFITAGSLLLFCASPLHAATYFSDTLTSGSLSGNFTQTVANASAVTDISYSGLGASFGTSGDSSRNYIRTVATDYNTQDFTASVTVTLAPAAGTDALFMGLGQGSLGAFGEPGGSEYLRVRPNSTDGVGNGPFNLTDLGTGVSTNNSTPTTFTMLMTYTASTNSVVFSVEDSSSNLIHSSTSVSASGLSSDAIFFGGSGNGTAPIFTNFSVQAGAIPEPSTYAVLAGGIILGFVVCRRRRRA